MSGDGGTVGHLKAVPDPAGFPRGSSKMSDGPTEQEPSREEAPVTRLIIVRHGETAWNVEKRLQGQMDVELNDVGRAQARQLAEAIQQSGLADEVDAIVSSDLSRARETADALAAVCPRCRRSDDDPDLREVHCGKLQGQEIRHIQADAQRVSVSWQRGDVNEAYPGGESAAAVMERGTRALRRASDSGSVVLVVTHAGLLKWLAVNLVLTGGDVQAELECTPARFRAEDIQAIFSKPCRNCCCSTVLWDRSRERFLPERWYEDYGQGQGQGGALALDDSDKAAGGTGAGSRPSSRPASSDQQQPPAAPSRKQASDRDGCAMI